MARRFVSLAALLTALSLAGAVVACRTTRPPAAAASPDAAIYAALLDSLHRPFPDTLLVGERTIAFRRSSTSGPPGFAAVPPELPAALVAASAVPWPAGALALPRPARVLRDAELREIFRAGADEGWREFARRYPTSRRYFGLSPIVRSADGRHALVYYEYHCGGLCGGGDLVLLQHDALGAWRVQRVIMYWVS